MAIFFDHTNWNLSRPCSPSVDRDHPRSTLCLQDEVSLTDACATGPYPGKRLQADGEMMLKSANNPEGLPMEVFDDLRKSLVRDRSSSTRISL